MKKILILFLLIIGLAACSEEEKIPSEKSSIDSANISLETLQIEVSNTDTSAVSLKYKFDEGKKFSYKLITTTESSQKLESSESVSSEMSQAIDYVFGFEVLELDEDNIADIQVVTKSIKMDALINGQPVKYQSGLLLSSREKVQFAEYEAMINNPFKVRISSRGEVLQVSSVDKIMTKMLETQGLLDSVKAEEKDAVFANAADAAIKPLVQQIFKMLPEEKVNVDSSWKFNYPGALATFQINNTAVFTVEKFYEENNDSLVLFDADLQIAVTGDKNYTENNVDYTFSKPEISAKGEIVFNLSKGLIKKSDTSTNVNMTMMASSREQGQNQKIFRYETTKSTNKVELL